MDQPIKEAPKPPAPETEFVAAPAFQAIEEIDLQELLRKVWRRKGVIISTIITLTVLATIILFQLTPKYTAQTLIMIDTRNKNVIDLEAVISGLSADAETIQSEIEVIRSRGLAAKVIGKMALDRNPEFNASLKPETFFAQYLSLKNLIPADWMSILTGRAAPEEPTEDEQQERQRIRVIDAFLEAFEVAPKGRSRVISIDFTSENPKTAALVANTLADLYIVEQLEAKFEATQKANVWLNERVSGLREKVEVSEKAVEAYRKKSGLLTADKGVTLVTQQITEINTQLILARSSRAEADARLQQIRKLVNSQGGVESAAEVLESLLIQRLREQEAEVERKTAELTTEYGERHPKMINARAEGKDIKAKIAGEVRKIVKGFENEASIAKTRENSFQKSLASLKQKVAASNTAEVQLRALQREANANRLLLETFLSRFKETTAQEDMDIQKADARIISLADTPDEPSFPKKRLILALVFVGSVFIGLMLVFLIEQLDRGFRSGEQVEQMTGLPTLGLVPILTGLSKIGKTPENYLLEKPTSAYGEAIRSLYTGLLLSHIDEPPKTVLITSALPKEGKSTIAMSLGRLQAKAGHKVIIVDTDLRRPSIGKSLGFSGKRGLVDVLAEEATLDEVIGVDEKSGAHVLPAGNPAPNPPDLLASDHMKRLLATLSQVYDLIILDSPPVAAVSDARILASEVDATIFVIRWADTRREMAIMSLKQIAASGAHLAGVVLSQVDAKKHARYGYGDSGYYYGRVKKYYTG